MTVDHAKAHELFSAAFDDELSGDEKAAFEAHLASCSACNKDFQEFGATLGSVHKLHRMSAPDQFVNSVRGQIHRRSRGRFFAPQRGTRFPMEIVTLITLAVVLIVYIIVRYAHPGLRF